MLELYTTLSRSQIDEDEVIVEESVDGMDFVAGVIFADAEEGSGTDVTFRLGYYLPGKASAIKCCCTINCNSGLCMGASVPTSNSCVLVRPYELQHYHKR